MNEFSILLVGLLGLSVGSFLNVLIDRLPKNESIIKKRSYCESCKKSLAWYDLVPIFSYIILQGKCRYCHRPISLYYPFVELITGVLFVLTVYTLGIMNQESGIRNILIVFYHLFIVSSLVTIFFTDLKYGIIPDKVIYPSVVITFLYLILNSYFLIPDSILSAIGTSLFFFLLFTITHGKGMGFGDVKLSFFMGLLLGFPKIIIALYIAFLTGAMLGIILIMLGRKKFGATIPFGPFLVVGTIVSLFWGELLQKIIISKFFL